MPKRAPSNAPRRVFPIAPRRPNAGIQRVVRRPRTPVEIIYGSILRAASERLPGLQGEPPRNPEVPVMYLRLGAQRVTIDNCVAWGEVLQVSYRAVSETANGFVSFPACATFVPLNARHFQEMLPSVLAVVMVALRSLDDAPMFELDETIGLLRGASQPDLRLWADELCAITCQPGGRFSCEQCNGEHHVVISTDDPVYLMVHSQACGPCVAADEPLDTTIRIPRDPDQRIPAIESSMSALLTRLRASAAQ